jgi:hypothetical protein
MIITSIGSYYTTWSCAKIAFTLEGTPQDQVLGAYPACADFFNGTNPHQQAVVHANFDGEFSTEIGAALGMTFGMSIWLATVLHVVGVEIYVSQSFQVLWKAGY